MGTYSQYGTGSFSGETIEMNEAYYGTGAIGLYKVMEESDINNRRIFEHVLGCDFLQVMAEQGTITESTYEAINEESTNEKGGIVDKVISFFKSLGAKIKAIIQGVIDRFSAFFTKDTNKLYRKFVKKITDKEAKGEYNDKFKYKWCEYNSQYRSTDTEIINKIFGAKVSDNCSNTVYKGKTIQQILSSAEKYFNDASTDFEAKKDARKDLNKAAKDYKKDDSNKDNRQSISSDDIKAYKLNIFKSIVPNLTEANKFNAEYSKVVFDEEKEITGLSKDRLEELINVLKGGQTILKCMDNEKKDVDRQIGEIIKSAKDMKSKITKKQMTGHNSTNAIIARALCSSVIAMGNACSACATTAFSASTAAYKKYIKQVRSVWVKAATFIGKDRATHEATLEMMGNISDYEVDQMLPEF